jgi:hypothetical protein
MSRSYTSSPPCHLLGGSGTALLYSVVWLCLTWRNDRWPRNHGPLNTVGTSWATPTVARWRILLSHRLVELCVQAEDDWMLRGSFLSERNRLVLYKGHFELKTRRRTAGTWSRFMDRAELNRSVPSSPHDVCRCSLSRRSSHGNALPHCLSFTFKQPMMLQPSSLFFCIIQRSKYLPIHLLSDVEWTGATARG